MIDEFPSRTSACITFPVRSARRTTSLSPSTSPYQRMAFGRRPERSDKALRLSEDLIL